MTCAAAALAVAAGGACGHDDAAPPAPSCKPFPRPPDPALRTEAIPDPPIAGGVRHLTFAAGKAYVLDASGAVPAAGVSGPFDDAIATDAALFATRVRAGGFDVVRIDRASKAETRLASMDGAPTADAALPLALGPDGKLYVGAPDRVIALDPNGDGSQPPTTFASGFRAVRALTFDRMTQDAWVVDRAPDADFLHRVRSNVPRAAAPPLRLDARLDGLGVIVRDGTSMALEGRWVARAGNALVVVDAFGPSGPPVANAHDVAGGAVVGVDEKGAAVLAGTSLARLVDDAKPIAPSSLRATGCLDLTRSVAYDVAVPLWSDGAQKDRAVFVPPGARARVMPDGDIRFPPGTIAMKTFARAGKRVETRLLVEHALDDWIGYSYAWNADETDAELVIGSTSRDGWYFPSSSDCTACHTPAAGYTLGIEARQLDDAAKAKLAPVLAGDLPPVPRLDPKDARAYLHANCSICHRDGSATGAADLDLRFDVPLERTNLCEKPKVSDLGIADARIVAPGAPEKSVLLARMRALDETRMPKLASHVVDEAGVATIEAWIRGLASCP